MKEIIREQLDAKFEIQESRLEEHLLKFCNGEHWAVTMQMKAQNGRILELEDELTKRERRENLTKSNSNQYEMLRAEVIETKTVKEAIHVIYSDLPKDSTIGLRVYVEVKKALNGRGPAPAYIRNILALLNLPTS